MFRISVLRISACSWDSVGLLGEPTGLCKQQAGSPDVFVREWTKSTVTVDCAAYSSTIKFK